MLARPGSDALAIDPHAAVGGLVEAFEEVLDLGVHLSVFHGVGRWATVDISQSWERRCVSDRVTG